MDSLYISVLNYDYILVFDAYMCKDCISPKIQKKKKILLISLDNDLMYEGRQYTKLNLKMNYPISDCYFLNDMEKKRAIIQKYPKNQLIEIK